MKQNTKEKLLRTGNKITEKELIALGWKISKEIKDSKFFIKGKRKIWYHEGKILLISIRAS